MNPRTITSPRPTGPQVPDLPMPAGLAGPAAGPDDGYDPPSPGPGASPRPGAQVAPADEALSSGRGLLFNVFIPLLILGVGIGVVQWLGAVQPEARPADDQTLAGRLRRLPAVDVTRVRSLQELGKPLELTVDGVVVPHREVKIATEVSGRIIEKSPLCRAGNFVAKGQLLVRIDPTDYEQEVLRLSQVREQDYEALKEVDQEIANAELSLNIAKEDVKLAQREVDRLRETPAGFVSEGEIDKAEKALLVSNQNRIAIENQKSLLGARRGRLEASERLATTQLETAKINLERCQILSPADGMIVREDAELNSFIVRGSPIVTLEDISKAEVAVNLRMDQLYWVLDQADHGLRPHEDEAEALAAIQREGYSLPRTPAIVEYEIAGLSGRTYRWNGTLVRYDGIGMDSKSRTMPVKIEVDEPDHVIVEDGSTKLTTSPSALVRGMFVRVKLLIQPKTPLVVIPATAMRPGNRVWQFVEDATVLDRPAGEPAAAEGTAGQANAEAAAKTAAESPPPAPDNVPDELPFDPAAWLAGRVVIHEGIAPVDTLRLSDDQAGSDLEARPGTRGGRRYWVCAVGEDQIRGGDLLITSPLGDLGLDSGETIYPVRILKSEAKR